MGVSTAMLPPQAAFALFTAVTALPSAPVPPAGGREAFAIERLQWRRHEVALREGEFLQATVHQRGADVKVRLVAPDGRLIEDAVDSSEGPVGMEPASVLAAVTGVYGIEVWAPNDVVETGQYDLETAAPRPPDARDRLRLEAEGLMAAASRVMGGRATNMRRARPDAAAVMDAVGLYAQASALWARLDERCWQAEARTCLADNLLWSQVHEETFDNFSQALELWQGCPGEDFKLAETVLFSGRWLVRESRMREAAEAYELGLRLTDHPVLRLQFLVQLSLAYGQTGETDAALRHGEDALPLLKARGWEQGTAVVLTHLADVRYRRGELQAAASLAQEALPLRRRQTDDPAGLVATLTTLGAVYDALGEPEIARVYLEEAAERNDVWNWSDEGGAIARLAAILTRGGEPARARALLDRSIAIARTAGHGRAEALARLQRAALSMQTGDVRDARANADAALGAVLRSGDRYVAAAANEILGRMQLQGGDADAARLAFAESLALRRAVGDRQGEATALLGLARVERASGGLTAARGLLEEARAIVSGQRGLLASPDLRATWSASVRGIDEEYVGLLMDLHRLHPDEGFDARAFEASEAASARTLLETLAERGRSPDDPELAAREHAVRERLTATAERELRARRAGLPAAVVEALAQEVLELSSEYHRVQADARAGDPRRAVPPSPVPLRLSEVQAQLLDADTTLVEFFVGAERGFAWVVGRDRMQSYDLPPGARIDAAVGALRTALGTPPPAGRPDPAEAALRALAELVLPADRGLLLGRRLVVVPDGSLHYVPFGALPGPSGRPLVTQLEIANVPSASVAASLRNLGAERAPAPRAVAVFGDPVYDAEDERLLRTGAPAVTDATLARATRGFGFRDGRLPRLPFTRAEAIAIRGLEPATSTAALDFKASLPAALSPEMASYRYVHFATHGLLNDTRPELSGLVLSLVDRGGRYRPGLLTAPDVARLRLNADLVVLSSCRSASGREVRGEGLVGLTRAFMDAGAPRVIASLWPVDDLASSQLMTRMYRELLGPRKATPAAALRAAQLATLAQPKWRAPYYWAGFQLQGDWR